MRLSRLQGFTDAHSMLQLVGVIFSDWYQPVKSGQAYIFAYKCAHSEKRCLVGMVSHLEAFSG